MHITLVTPPFAEPLTLAEVQLSQRVDSQSDNNLLSGLIRAARVKAETYTERTIPAATWRLTLDRFPLYDGSPPRRGASLGVGAWEYLEPRRIILPRPPLVSVNSLTYYDTAGVLQTVVVDVLGNLATDPNAIGLWSNLREPGIIEPVYGQVWPTARYQADSVQVEYTAGWNCSGIAASIAAGTQTVTPSNMAGIVVGSNLTIDLGSPQEIVTVTAVTSTTFTATFAQAHTYTAPTPIKCCGVPDTILQAMKLMVGDWYEHREDGERKLNTAAEQLLLNANYGAYP